MKKLVNFCNKIAICLVNIVKQLKSVIFLDKDIYKFINHNKKVWQDWKVKKSNKVILIGFYGVAETNIARSYFVNVLAKKHKAVIKSFGPPEKIPNLVLHKVYQSFNTSSHIVTVLNKEQKQRQKALFKKIMPKIKTKKNLFDLKVLSIWIGVDIYETYLRKCNKPTVFLDDPSLLEMVKEGVGLVIFWQDYFAKNKVVAVVVSHDCYLRFNVVSKIAYQKKIPVYLPNPVYMSLVSRPYMLHAYLKNYREMFAQLPPKEQKKGINWAKKQLKRRLSGEVGVDMPYAVKSAFQLSKNKRSILKKSKNIKVLICSHCFYDNPHAYGGMLFLDFYEWLCYLGRISEQTNYDWYLKVHPDPLPGTIENIKAILAHYPKITIIPYQTSHHQLAKEGIDFVLTAYGTVGHEYPVLGVQVINAGYNPHIAYDFNWHPKDLKEYEHLLLNLDKPNKKKINLKDLYEFYYMHHNYVYDDDFVFKSYRRLLLGLTKEQRVGSTVYGYFLDQLTQEKHKKIIKIMCKFIDSGKQYYFG